MSLLAIKFQKTNLSIHADYEPEKFRFDRLKIDECSLIYNLLIIKRLLIKYVWN